MRIPKDAAFDTERLRYSLIHCCEECGLFDPQREVCAHEWPHLDHRRSAYEGEQAASRSDLLFCKEFEAC